jgi:hypothetical protein
MLRPKEKGLWSQRQLLEPDLCWRIHIKRVLVFLADDARLAPLNAQCPLTGMIT